MQRCTPRWTRGLLSALVPGTLCACQSARPVLEPPASPPARVQALVRVPWGEALAGEERDDPGSAPAAGIRLPNSTGPPDPDPTTTLATSHPAEVPDPASESPVADMQGVIVSRVTIVRRNVFGETDRPQWLFQTLNKLHVTTLERVIRRELLLAEGDMYDPELAAETERILRRLDYIADARVYPVPLPDGTAELHVETRERFTLRAGGSVGFFGGTSSTRVSLGESNLFGLGKELTLKYRELDGDGAYGVSFKDPQFLTTHHVLRLSAANSDDGGSLGFSLVQPFRALDDEVSYGIDFAHAKGARTYYALGEDLAEVPTRTTGGSVFLTRAFGPRRERTKVGLRAGYRASRYSTATGVAAQQIPVPGNLRRFEIGPTLAFEYRPFFAELENVDAMGVIEDVPLGFTVSSFLGVQHREEKGRGAQDEGVLSANFRWAGQLWGDQLVTFSTTLRQRLHSGDSKGFASASALHYYYLGLPYQTLAASVAFDMVRETENLPIQMTLGEDNGLRGYEAKFFTGDRRLRINLEDRLIPDLELLSVRLGAVVFFDAGLAWNRRESIRISDLYRSVGVGLRLGSPEVVRRDVVRIDLAYPLDDHPLEDFNISLSLSVGQIFEIFGNAEGLDREF